VSELVSVGSTKLTESEGGGSADTGSGPCLVR
jgi:hypothetical protein